MEISLPPDYQTYDLEPLPTEVPPEDDDEGEEDKREEVKEANKILDDLKLPNYDDVELRLAEPEMTPTLKRNYLLKVNNDPKKGDKV